MIFDRELNRGATYLQRSASAERYAIKRAKAYLRERLHERTRLDDLADHVRLDK